MRTRVGAPKLGLLTLGAILLLFGAPGTAHAKSFTLPEAVIDIKVRGNGNVAVTEHITYSFDGSFSGGYREIPHEGEEAVTNISVSEGGLTYSPGAPAELGSSGAPGTFGVAELGDRTRIVWHYEAFTEQRTFSVSYLFPKLATAYDDVVDVALQVWGEEWGSELSRLEVNVDLPGAAPDEVLVWGHPEDISGATELRPDGTGAQLLAAGIPPHRFVEMRVVFPTSLLRSTEAATVVDGAGLEKIKAEELAIAREDARSRERREWLRANALLLALAGFALLFLPGLVICAFIWMRYGREPRVAEVPHHIMEPPGEEAPALIRALLTTGHARATGDAFTATLFDLIRRGFIEATSTTTYKKKWAGLKEEETSDLLVQLTDKNPELLEAFEKEVWEAVQHAQDERDSFPLSEMKDDIAENPTFYSERFSGFKSGVGTSVARLGWWISEGRSATAIAWIAALVVTAACIFAGVSLFDPVAGFPWGTVAWIYGAFVAGTTLVILTIFGLLRRGWERRSTEGAEKAASWDAFRRFLSEFAGIPGATPGSIVIWEQYLCYGIAFGVADRVLAAAELHAPPELAERSSVYWISPGGHLGAGSSAFAISDISGAVASAAPPSSSGGGGGGFSGGGGGGGFSGGGGGGAW